MTRFQRASLLLVLAPLASALAVAACGSSVETSPSTSTATSTRTWACVEITDAAGTHCTCADPPPAGKPVDDCKPYDYKADDWYECCVFDGKTCSCSQDYDACVASDHDWEASCKHADLCPANVGEGTACSIEGMECPGEGEDPDCWDWTCSCVDGAFYCEAGTCA